MQPVRNRFATALAVALMIAPMAGGPRHAVADYTDHSGDRVMRGALQPSPAADESGIRDYRQMDEQINLDADSGDVVVLRTDQKIGLHEYEPHLIPIRNLDANGVRELLPIVRRICGIEGGNARVVRTRESGESFIEVTCTPEQWPFVEDAVMALDRDWLSSTNDGTGVIAYKAQYRDVAVIDRLARQYAEGESVLDREDNSVVHTNTPSYSYDYVRLARKIDIPVHEISVEARFYEIDLNNDLNLGLDYIAWKNSSWDLFHIGADSLRIDGPGVAEEVIRNSYRGYNAYLLSTFYDFMRIKGRSRVLASATIQTVSGVPGVWDSYDPIQSIRSDARGTVSGGQRPQLSPTHFSVLDGEALVTFALQFFPPAEGAYEPTREDLNGMNDWSIVQLLYRAYGYEILREMERRSIIFLDHDAFWQNTGTDWDRWLDYPNWGAAGLLLRVLPVVGLESTEMYVYAEAGSLTGYTPTGTPIVNRSELETIVRVQDGEQIILAGMTRTEDVSQKAGMPFLSDLPVIGYLFGGETSIDRRKRIVISLETDISAGLVSSETGRPLTVAEVEELKSLDRYGEMEPESAPIRDGQARVRRQVEGAETLDIPPNAFGFDQWLIDPEPRAVKRLNQEESPSEEPAVGDSPEDK